MPTDESIGPAPAWDDLTPAPVRLRPVTDDDLDAIFEWNQDPEAVRMAAFTREDPSDRAAFDEHMGRIRARPDVTLRAIEVDGELAGTVSSFVLEGDTEVTYWLDRRFWGRGVATRALALLLEQVPVRPVTARAAADNVASRRVLEKCGFVPVGEDEGYAAGRGEVVREVIMTLR